MERWKNIRLEYQDAPAWLTTGPSTPVNPDHRGRPLGPKTWASMRVLDGIPDSVVGTSLGAGNGAKYQRYRFRFPAEDWVPAVNGNVRVILRECLTPLPNDFPQLHTIQSVKPVYAANGMFVTDWEIETAWGGSTV